MLALALAAPASAQVFTGRIDVSIEDPGGTRVPGATVDLLGASSQTQISDAQGQAHFLNLPVGVYTVRVSMPGFAPNTNSNVEVLSGASTALALKLERRRSGGDRQCHGGDVGRRHSGARPRRRT